MSNLSSMIRNKRFEKNISQRELAMASNIDRTTLSEIENGIRKKPKIDTLVKLSDGLGIPLASLLYSAGYNYEQINKILGINSNIEKKSDYYLSEFEFVLNGECILNAKSKEKARKKFENILNNLLSDLINNNEEFKNLFEGSDKYFNYNLYQIDVEKENEENED